MLTFKLVLNLGLLTDPQMGLDPFLLGSKVYGQPKKPDLNYFTTMGTSQTNMRIYMRCLMAKLLDIWCVYIYRQVVVVNKLIPGGHHLGSCRFVSIGKELVE